jgi:hypothetical protein
MKLDEFTTAYITAALWSSTDDADTPLDSNYSASDLAAETFAKMTADCERFQADHGDLNAEDLERAGHDFWLTRNHHGAGFWDGDWPDHGDALTEAAQAYPDVDLYVGDDGAIYA